MTTPAHIDEITYREMADALFPGHGNSKLARSAIELIVRDAHMLAHPSLDIGTLKSIVDFLIKEKGYN